MQDPCSRRVNFLKPCLGHDPALVHDLLVCPCLQASQLPLPRTGRALAEPPALVVHEWTSGVPCVLPLCGFELSDLLASMNLVDLFPSERVFVNVDVSSRKDLLGFLSERAAELGLVNGQLCSRAVAAREELGSTGLGHGVAIPHARIENLEKAVGLLAILSSSIDFEAVDQERVDIVLMLLMPAQSGGDPLKVLSAIAKFARQDQAMNALRRADSVEGVIEVLRHADADN